MTTAKKTDWLDIPCPTCHAEVNEGCIVFGSDTLMKIKLNPHKRRVKEAEKLNSKEKLKA
jgi:hypothetical protein